MRIKPKSNRLCRPWGNNCHQVLVITSSEPLTFVWLKCAPVFLTKFAFNLVTWKVIFTMNKMLKEMPQQSSESPDFDPSIRSLVKTSPLSYAIWSIQNVWTLIYWENITSWRSGSVEVLNFTQLITLGRDLCNTPVQGDETYRKFTVLPV